MNGLQQSANVCLCACVCQGESFFIAILLYFSIYFFILSFFFICSIFHYLSLPLSPAVYYYASLLDCILLFVASFIPLLFLFLIHILLLIPNSFLSLSLYFLRILLFFLPIPSFAGHSLSSSLHLLFNSIA